MPFRLSLMLHQVFDRDRQKLKLCKLIMRRITCVVVSLKLPTGGCNLSWTFSADVLEKGAEKGNSPPPVEAAGLGRRGFAAMAGLGGKGPAGRLGRAGFR